jgi:hypothetical protein
MMETWPYWVGVRAVWHLEIKGRTTISGVYWVLGARVELISLDKGRNVNY